MKETVPQTDCIYHIAISFFSFTFYMNCMFVLQCLKTCMEELLVSDYIVFKNVIRHMEDSKIMLAKMPKRLSDSFGDNLTMFSV